jgi:hypothetical protein
MNPVALVVEGERGLMFEGDEEKAVVFVPEHTITPIGDEWRIDQTAFFVSGWAEKNMRFSGADVEADRVFPIESRPIKDDHDPRVIALLARLKNVYEVSVA